MDDGELEQITVWTAYQWDCPGCEADNTVDHDPSGETLACEVCGDEFEVAGVR